MKTLATTTLLLLTSLGSARALDPIAAVKPQQEAWILCLADASYPHIGSKTDPGTIATMSLGLCQMEENTLRAALTSQGISLPTAKELVQHSRERQWAKVVDMLSRARMKR